jgi:hypothetical protein
VRTERTRERSGTSDPEPVPVKILLSGPSAQTFHTHIFLGLCFLLLLPACSTPGSLKSKPDEQSRPSRPYVQVSEVDSNLVELKVAVRKFVPARGPGPAVWLSGVTHIGDSNYFAAMQAHLDAQSLVLYEGVSRVPSRPPTRGVQAAADPATPTRTAHARRPTFQSSLASSLGLAYQLEAINYHRPHFRNSDLTVPELRRLLAELEAASGQTGASSSFDQLLEMMEGGSFFDSLLQVGLRFLSSTPKLQALSKLALIEVLGDLEGDPSRMRGLQPQFRQLLEVLLEKRDQKLITELKKQLPEVGSHGSIALFYGTGHMADLEMRLREELHYRLEGELWLTAFSVDLTRADISRPEREFLRAALKKQL